MREISYFIESTVFIIALIYMMRGRGLVATGTIDQNPLTKTDKIWIWATCLLNPIMAGAAFYFGWRKVLPMKAKQANRISWIAFAIILVATMVFMSVVIYTTARETAEHKKQFERAVALIREQKFDDAQRVLLDLDGKIESVGVYYNLAITYEAQSNLRKAEELLQNALNIDPEDAKARDYYDEIRQKRILMDALDLARNGKIAEAKQMLILQEGTNKPDVNDRVERWFDALMEDPTYLSLMQRIYDYGAPKDARSVVEDYMKYTLGTIPGAKIDYEAARILLTSSLFDQFNDPAFVPTSYCIQDGPTSVRIASEVLDKKMKLINIIVEAQYGNEWKKMWNFQVVPFEGAGWMINKIECL